MSLNHALSIGSTALQVSQNAMEVIGNNLANAATPGYTRQSARLAPIKGYNPTPRTNIGSGVELQKVVRHVDQALVNRIRAATSDSAASEKRFDLLSEIESIMQELTDTGLNTRLSEFFNAWSELADNPTDNALKSLVIQEGIRFSDYASQINEDLTALRSRVDGSMQSVIEQANGIMEEIAKLNQDIVTQEAGRGDATGGANALRDERDKLLNELSEVVDISIVEHSSGVVDVFVSSVPIVLNVNSRGLRLDVEAEGDVQTYSLRVAEDGTILDPRSGALTQLMASREEDVNGSVEVLNDIIGQVIYQTNRVHSQGQGNKYFDSVTSTFGVEDPTTPISREDQNLPFAVGHGSFVISTIQKSTGTREEHLIIVDEDGVGGANMSLQDIADQIDAIDHLDATINYNGTLSIDSDLSDFQFGFSDDTSGFLASMGINTFFSGFQALDIQVNEVVQNDLQFLAVGSDYVAGSNGTALEIAQLKNKPQSDLDGRSLEEMWINTIEDYAIRTSETESDVVADNLVLENLEAQRQGISGVSLDEQSVDLIRFQQTFQGAARYLNVVQEMMDIVSALVR